MFATGAGDDPELPPEHRRGLPRLEKRVEAECLVSLLLDRCRR